MMRLQWLLLLSLSLYIVHVQAIILPDETDSASASSSSTTTPPTVGFTPQARPTPTPLASNSRTTTPTTVIKDTSTDIAENIAELDVDLLDRGHSSKEVQDSDGGQRQNYASKDSGATVLDHAPGTKGSVNLLVPDKDRYMLIPCATEKKWIVISLSEDIHADEIALANYEKFSSTTREFLVLGSINYPSDTWVVLGNFTAANHNGEQLFEFHEKHHVRYIKLRLMSHYGSEYYCTMSQIRVFGRTFTQVISQLEKNIEAAESQTLPTPQPATSSPNVPLELPACYADPSETRALFLDVISSSRGPHDLDIHNKNMVCLLQSDARLHGNGSNASTDVASTSTSAATTSSGASVTPFTSNESQTTSTPPRTTPSPSSSTVAGSQSNSAAGTDLSKALEIHRDGPKEGGAMLSAVDEGGKLAPTPSVVATNGGGLDNFYIRMSKKLQALENNVTQLEKVVLDLQRTHAVDVQYHRAQASAAVDALATLKGQVRETLSGQANRTDDLARQVHLLVQANRALQEQVDLLWDVIQTMKAGIMITLVLSVALLVFSLCRWIFRCLTACHRRAARREWFRRLDVADTTESSLDKRPSMMADDTDEDINPLTHSMHHRLDRSMRFGSSYDDNAIQRNTMYRRYDDKQLLVLVLVVVLGGIVIWWSCVGS
ncbi:hypothetical protein, variant [Aphanomyces astaci]|uniref:SUN domain-containing protein n=1 Tax=Aphanomyces astaci TaxID=112090 RepID=W4H5D9_APHAT|nr:hypothetical protein, variant [Aphanomyces astaci]ETV86353.1 hypothetical protein, variant [Aphanomyces astaci]|eukprot:XP_009824825.1 hypothetical protein, variant [Aphanomyces astaci]